MKSDTNFDCLLDFMFDIFVHLLLSCEISCADINYQNFFLLTQNFKADGLQTCTNPPTVKERKEGQGIFLILLSVQNKITFTI